MAIKDYQTVVKLEPENKAARNQMVICSQKVKQFQEREKQKYLGMFSKFAEKDSKKVLYIN